MRKEVMDTVDRELGAIARPGAVHFVTLLPKTRSGKLLRRSIQALAEGRDPGDLTTIEDPARSSRSAPRWRRASAGCDAGAIAAARGSAGDNMADLADPMPAALRRSPAAASAARRPTCRSPSSRAAAPSRASTTARSRSSIATAALLYAAGDPGIRSR